MNSKKCQGAFFGNDIKFNQCDIQNIFQNKLVNDKIVLIQNKHLYYE